MSTNNNTTIINKSKTLSLAECGLNEDWLQNKIWEDPSILQLGDLVPVHREKKQSSGGRLDILLKDPEDDSMYEVEVMQGKTDESHIIRTIEYWDLEKKRWPKRSHTAVLVAEKITSRFYNVIHLLSHNLPIVGIQYTIIEIDGKRCLHFEKIIDSYEEPEIETTQDEQSYDEEYWQQKAPNVFAYAQSLTRLAEKYYEDVELRLLGDLRISIGGINRILIRSRGNGRNAQINFRVEPDAAEKNLDMLEQKGITAELRHKVWIRFTVQSNTFEQYQNDYIKLLEVLYSKNLQKKKSE